MKRKKILKCLHWTEADIADIKNAVARAERQTSGEITIAAAGQSDSYSFFELAAALCAGAIVFAAMLPCASEIAAVIDRMTWHTKEWYLPAVFGLIWILSAAVFFAAANIHAIDRLIVPRSYRHQAVQNRAFRCFTESGIYATAEHSGILIFISCLEREVFILADTGICEKIGRQAWDGIAQDIAAGFSSKTGAKNAVITAAEKCAELLSEHFPPAQNKRNELSDDITILED
ncbi:MAG: hypothetical protein NC041_06560 [Bacteroides sp.]|nr:hypothetical protein [Prevotella sp.]MCM1406958.1 hypothetical protein [Treponema brennaborense]MCM1470109.1 hypothetical protein [Bacteroides sp.]